MIKIKYCHLNVNLRKQVRALISMLMLHVISYLQTQRTSLRKTFQILRALATLCVFGNMSAFNYALRSLYLNCSLYRTVTPWSSQKL